MKKLALVCGILASVVVSISVGVWAMSGNELDRARDNCLNNEDKSACEAFFMNALPNVEQCYGEGVSCFFDTFPSVEQCDKNTCFVVGLSYGGARRYKEAIPYFEKAIALGENYAAPFLATIYGNLRDYPNEKKYFEMGCNKGNGDLVQALACSSLGEMYYDGKGVRQDYAKAAELWKKACDMKLGIACGYLGALYGKGEGVRQDKSIAKQYFGKACDLGNQLGCDDYRTLNERGVE